MIKEMELVKETVHTERTMGFATMRREHDGNGYGPKETGKSTQ
jgi:hypothetical protein